MNQPLTGRHLFIKSFDALRMNIIPFLKIVIIPIIALIGLRALLSHGFISRGNFLILQTVLNFIFSTVITVLWGRVLLGDSLIKNTQNRGLRIFLYVAFFYFVLFFIPSLCLKLYNVHVFSRPYTTMMEFAERMGNHSTTIGYIKIGIETYYIVILRFCLVFPLIISGEAVSWKKLKDAGRGVWGIQVRAALILNILFVFIAVGRILLSKLIWKYSAIMINPIFNLGIETVNAIIGRISSGIFMALPFIVYKEHLQKKA